MFMYKNKINLNVKTGNKLQGNTDSFFTITGISIIVHVQTKKIDNLLINWQMNLTDMFMIDLRLHLLLAVK